MDDDVQELRKARLTVLKRKLKAREGQSEYRENCVAIREKIAQLETIIAAHDELVADPEDDLDTPAG